MSFKVLGESRGSGVVGVTKISQILRVFFIKSWIVLFIFDLVVKGVGNGVTAHSRLTALVLVRVVAAVVHPVTDLVCTQADAVVSAAEGPGRRARVLCCGETHTNAHEYIWQQAAYVESEVR